MKVKNMPWAHFNDVPSEDEMGELIDEFFGKNPRFDGFVKIGKTTFDPETAQPGHRYGQYDRYEELTDSNILCDCSTEEIALQIEQLAQKVARERDILIQFSDAMDGALSGDTSKRFCVYITMLKSDLYKCPIESCSIVATHERIMQHRMDHKFIRFATNAKNMAIRNSLQPPKIVTSPVPVSF